jgi:hypothetical protein
MKTKSLVVVLVLTVLIFTTGSVYSKNAPPGSVWKAHPWEDSNNSNNRPSLSSNIVIYNDHNVIVIPIFSDFLIWIFIKDVPKGSDHQKNSINTDVRSYQIIFPW